MKIYIYIYDFLDTIFINIIFMTYLHANDKIKYLIISIIKFITTRKSFAKR